MAVITLFLLDAGSARYVHAMFCAVQIRHCLPASKQCIPSTEGVWLTAFLPISEETRLA